MKKIIDYKVITGLNVDVMETDINEALDLGYQPFGAPFMAMIGGSYCNCQAMILKSSWRIWRIWRIFKPLQDLIDTRRSIKAYKRSQKALIDKCKEIQLKNIEIQILKPEEEK